MIRTDASTEQLNETDIKYVQLNDHGTAPLLKQ